MTDATTLQELLRRVEGAAGTDREIDAAIAAACDPLWSGYRVISATPSFISTDNLAHVAQPANYSNSVDASLALVDRCLPGAAWSVSQDFDGPPRAHLAILPMKGPEFRPVFYNADAPTVCLAVIRALLSALIAQANAPQERA